MADTLNKLIHEVNGLIDEITKMASNPDTTAEGLTGRMNNLEAKIAEMREYPDAEWQQARNDILGLSANLDSMQTALTREYEKSRDELSQLSNRSKAQKLYAAYDQPENQQDPNAENETIAPAAVEEDKK